jgi:hypothetical protein
MFMTDVLDEYVLAQLTEYEDLKLINISKEDMKVGLCNGGVGVWGWGLREECVLGQGRVEKGWG